MEQIKAKALSMITPLRAKILRLARQCQAKVSESYVFFQIFGTLAIKIAHSSGQS